MRSSFSKPCEAHSFQNVPFLCLLKKYFSVIKILIHDLSFFLSCNNYRPLIIYTKLNKRLFFMFAFLFWSLLLLILLSKIISEHNCILSRKEVFRPTLEMAMLSPRPHTFPLPHFHASINTWKNFYIFCERPAQLFFLLFSSSFFSEFF